jgi:hypothetical protein
MSNPTVPPDRPLPTRDALREFLTRVAENKSECAETRVYAAVIAHSYPSTWYPGDPGRQVRERDLNVRLAKVLVEIQQDERTEVHARANAAAALLNWGLEVLS